jgi:hypothetical protein
LYDRDLRELLEDSVSQIESGVRDYKAGDLAAYRRVASELYNLLVDTNPRSGPLLTRVFPDASFHRFHEPRSAEPSAPGKASP